MFVGDKVLMVKNPEGMWGFPKGHREDNETPIEAAIRETQEETGIIVPDDIKPLGKASIEYT